MGFELFSVLFGLIKLFIYKLFYFRRVKFSGIPKLNHSFAFGIKKRCHLSINKGFRSRNNISIRVYDGGLVEIGKNCFLNDNCSINAKKKISFGEHVILGPGVQVYDHDHNYKSDDVENNFVTEEIRIGNNVWIGANSIILKGSVIGDGCVIAAGTIVKGNIPSGSMVYDKRDRQIVEIKK